MKEKLGALTKDQTTRTVTVEELREELIEKVLALTEAQTEYVLRRLQCLLQSEN